MHYLDEDSPRLPSGIEGQVPDRPTSWQGMDLTWLSNEKPELVYLGRFVARGIAARARQDVHLLGARYELADVLVGRDALGDGYFLEFFVAAHTSERWSVHRLLQSTSVTYSERDEESDYVQASDVSDPTVYSLAGPPAWKVSTAVWPTSGGVPMTFLGQLELPDTDLTRLRLTWDTTVFLFASGDNALQFKAIEQDTTAPSAEEHYLAEEETRE